MVLFFKILALVFLAAVLSSVKRYEHLTRAFNRFSCGVWLAAQITMDSKDKKASWEGAVVSKDEFAEYEHGANESHGDDERRDANEDGAAAGKAAADVAAAAGEATADAAAADDAVAGATPAKAPTKAPPLPKTPTPRPAVALIGRPFALSAGSGALLGNRAPSGVACRIRTRCCRRASSMRALSPRSESAVRRALRKIGSTTTRK